MLSFSMVLLINLCFVIFYDIDEKNEVIIRFDWAELLIDALSIIQAIIAFVVIIAYFLQYHGVIR